jgi:transcriptional regulator with XRE-family HTH domain
MGVNMEASNGKRAIADRIIALRNNHQVKQRELADAISVDPSSMNRIEKGDRAVSVAEILRIADFFGVSAESILREPDAGVLFRGGDQRGAAVEDSLGLFEAVICDYFGARATVS